MERADEIAEMITKEVGKTIRESREEMVEYTADHFRRASEDVLRHAGSVLPSTQERTNDKRIIVVQEPVGVVAAVTPWNFPVAIAGIPIVGGLALGCTAVWKPSEQAPLCANMFAEVIHDAGFPPGTLNVVHGRGDVGSALVAHPDVASVVFTGSTRTGEQVARDAALKNRVLRVGGNGPQIVLADANLGKAADAAIVGCFTSPASAARPRDPRPRVREGRVRRGAHRADEGAPAGDPLDEETDMGPLCTDEVLARTIEHVEDAVAKGADRLRGGHEGRFHEPTILDGVTSEMSIAKEETFGPVAPIMTFGDRRGARHRGMRPTTASPPPSSRALSTTPGTRRKSSGTERCTSTRRRTTGTSWRRSARRSRPAASSPGGSSTP